MKTRNPFLDIPKFNHEEFLTKIKVIGECWEWQGAILSNGYGGLTINLRSYKAHRVSYDLFNGNLSNKLLIDHTCRNRLCVNPDHLRQVTDKVNVTENSISIPYLNSIKSHCQKGHEFTHENTKMEKWGSRRCRECEKLRSIRRRLKSKEGKK